LKQERIKKRIYPTRERALPDIAEYVENFYHRTRRRSYFGGSAQSNLMAAIRVLDVKIIRYQVNRLSTNVW
jgi:hypothetical protein